MIFYSSVELPPPQRDIQPNTPLLLVGSCFSDEMGALLHQHKFNTCTNPFGVIFNPLSIFDILIRTCQHKDVAASLFVKRKEVWLHLGVHSQLSALSQGDLEQKIQTQQHILHQFFASTRPSYLFITLGTAWVYRHLATQELVANCHKLPAQAFRKELLTVTQIVEKFRVLKTLLPPSCRVILTVSPVRHLKDTLPLNAVSKAVLRLACHQIIAEASDVQYFPAYEIMTDELRDYRFYEPDLIHPTPQAVRYIFEKLTQVLLSTESQLFCQEWQGIAQQLAHQSLHPTTHEHQAFLRQLLTKLLELQKKYIDKDFSVEIQSVAQQLTTTMI